MAWTKEHRAEYMKQYRQENRERINANQRYWYRIHLEQEQERSRADSKTYYDKHKDEDTFKQKRYAAVKKWIENNREKYNAYQREYQKRRRTTYEK